MPSEIRFVHLIPSGLSPLDAVRAYAEMVAGWQGTSLHASSCVIPVNRHDICEQLNEANPAVVFLHYINYGYSKRGCPRWLAAAVEQTKEKLSYKLVTFFHEVYASGRIWSSSYWTSPIQKSIARRLLVLSQCCVTTLQLYKELLLSLAPLNEKSIEVFPVLSVLGEPQPVPDWSDREPILVILGGAGSRSRLYRESIHHMEQVCEVLQIREVVDFGPEVDAAPLLPPSVSYKKMGLCEPERIGSFLLRAKAGLMNYPAAFLAKSTVFASYAAHGVLPVCASNRNTQQFLRSDALQSGSYYWNPEQPLRHPETIVHEVYEWYRGHCMPLLAEALESHLRGSGLGRSPGRVGA